MGKPERERPFGWPRRRWEDNIKMDWKEVGCVPGDWDQWRAVMNVQVP